TERRAPRPWGPPAPSPWALSRLSCRTRRARCRRGRWRVELGSCLRGEAVAAAGGGHGPEPEGASAALALGGRQRIERALVAATAWIGRLLHVGERGALRALRRREPRGVHAVRAFVTPACGEHGRRA